MTCHADTGDPGASHQVAAMGCRVCHLGDGSADEPDDAHRGMVRFPGDLDVAPRTCGTCHAAIVARVQSSSMNTGRGMVAVNRFAFGEQATPDGDDTIADLGTSPADRHFRQLCIACHLGASRLRQEPGGASDDRPRRGGCAGCHLQVQPGQESGRDRGETPGSGHGRLVLHPDDEACSGCHSGSSRIALSYHGWYETTMSIDEARASRDPGRLRILDDGRVLAAMPADVHADAGMACIDCHTPREVMGYGDRETGERPGPHRHGEQAIEIACQDCHRTTPPETVSGDALDLESLTLIRLDPGLPRSDRAFVTTRRALALVNVVVPTSSGDRARDSAGDRAGAETPGSWLEVHEKHTGRIHRAGPPSLRCASPGHERLACQTCHAAWAPQCLGCHIRREPDGVFREYEGGFLAEPSTLAVRDNRIVPAVPGMIMTLDDGRGERLVRLFAPITPHTIRRRGRTCASCHRDPVALGYGRGALEITVPAGPRPEPGQPAEKGPYRLRPRYQALDDGLPADAWIAVLDGSDTPAGGRATRSDMRPLDVVEQRRVLRVGECLACHDGDERAIYGEFAAALEAMKPGCHRPGSAPGSPTRSPASSQ